MLSVTGGVDVTQYRLGEGPYGSAYRGTVTDLFEAGDLKHLEVRGRTFGLFLGHFDWQQSIRQTWQEPARGLWAWFSDERIDREHTEAVPQVQDLRYTGDQHHLIVASSGAGKFRDVLSNMLLYDGSCETACLIIDPKGEIASTIGPLIDRPGDPGARTIILDPWDMTQAGRTDSLTLLDGLRVDNPHCVKDARVLADAIIIERSAEDGHWAVTAKNFLAALLLYLGLDPIEEGERTLFRLRQIVTTPWNELTDLFGYMSDSALFEGLVARAARAMLNRDEKERRAIFSTLERDTAFVEDPGLWKAIKTSSFDMNQLVMSNKRLHVIVPFDYTDQMSSWLRLTIAAFYNSCLRNQLPRNWPTYLQFRHIIIDEFAGLGKLDFIMKGVAEARGAGIKYHLVIQNFPQLHSLYREGWENLVSNSFVHAFGINDNFTSEYLSKMTGQSTVITQSTGVSSSATEGTSFTKGTSHSSTNSGSTSGSSNSTSTSYSYTKGTSTTFSSTGRPVLMPDEIRRISGTQQLLFIRQLPVFLTRRTPYFHTFRRFLQNHTLRDVLNVRHTSTGNRSLVAVGTNTLATSGPLSSVNSVMRMPQFEPPPYRPFTFREALLQSPGIIASFIFLVLFLLWLIPHEIATSAEASREAAVAQQRAAQDAAARLIAEQQAQRRADEERQAAAALEAQAQTVDNTLLEDYDRIASAITYSLAHIGVCSSEDNTYSLLQCSVQSYYQTSSLKPIRLGLSAQRKVIANFDLSPKNEKRGDEFSGIVANMSVESVFDRVDISDRARFPFALRRTISAILQAFKVSEAVATNCMAQDISTVSNGTTVSCRFEPRPPTEGGLAQFVMTLSRKM